MRSYRTFIQWAQETLGITLASSAIFTVISLIQYGLGTPAEMLEYIALLFPLYILILSVFILPIMMASIYQVYIPVGISLGCSRRKSFLGGYILQIAACTETIFLVLILQIFSGWKVFEGSAGEGIKFLAAVFFCYLALTALGQLLGIIYLRYGKLGIMLIILFFAACGAAVGAIAGMTLIEGVHLFLYTDMIFKAGIISVFVICVFSGLFIHRQIYRLEIKN